MISGQNKTFGYFFLNKRLHPPFPKDYRVSIILLIVNNNSTPNKDKFLAIQQANEIWGLPKEGVKSDIVIEDLYTTISRNLEDELGFKGIKVVETKPVFSQVAFFFNFDKQNYDITRSMAEKEKGRPVKGKIYLLAMMKYYGPDEIPLHPNNEVRDYRWVTKNEGVKLLESNIRLVENKKFTSINTARFDLQLFKKVVDTYLSVSVVLSDEKQNTLL